MKRVFSLILIAIILAVPTGCSKKSKKPESKNNSSSTVTLSFADWKDYHSYNRETEWELTIKSINDKEVVFSLLKYRLANFSDVRAEIKQDTADFTATEAGGTIRGSLLFSNTEIIIMIKESNHIDITPQTLYFNKSENGNITTSAESGEYASNDSQQNYYTQSLSKWQNFHSFNWETEWEITITYIDDNYVTFNLNKYRLNGFDNVSANIQENIADFSAQGNNCIITGYLVFYDDSIGLVIDEVNEYNGLDSFVDPITVMFTESN